MANEEAPYSNRQIERMFDTQKESFEGQLQKQSVDLKIHIDNAVAPVLAQTTQHNGRMKKHERYLIILGVAVVSLFASNPELAKVLISAFL